MKQTLIICLLAAFFTVSGFAQQDLSLEECYRLAEANHPLQKQYDLLSQKNEYELQVIDTQKYPKFLFEASVSYQSAVVELPFSIPNVDIGSIDKDQYRATLNINQVLYNGGLTDHQKQIKTKELAVGQQEISKQLHTLKMQLNQAYFTVLLLQEKIKIIKQTQTQLEEKRQELESKISKGVLYERAKEPVTLALLEVQQKKVELQADKNLWVNQLKLLTGLETAKDVNLQLPNISSENALPRSELKLFDLQQELSDLQASLIQKQAQPKVIAFGTAGYGKPGLNMLSNSFEDFYLAGIKLQWDIYDFNAKKKQRQAIGVQREIIDNQREQFLWQQHLKDQNFTSELDKLNTLLQTDNEIISMRQKLLTTAEKQLKHDLITTAELTEVINALQTARINKTIHEIQIALTKANQKITLYD